MWPSAAEMSPLGDLTVQVPRSIFATAFSSASGSDVGQFDRHAGYRRDMSDTVAHQPGPDHTEFSTFDIAAIPTLGPPDG